MQLPGNRRDGPPRLRILIVDRNASTHETYRGIFGAMSASAFAPSRRSVKTLGMPERTPPLKPAAVPEPGYFSDLSTQLESSQAFEFDVDFAIQGSEAASRVAEARAGDRPYVVVFVDAGEPPFRDIVATIARIWEGDPEVQIVLCTASLDLAWREVRRKLAHAGRLVILRKPLEAIEVLQLAESLTEKWSLNRQDRCRLAELEQRIRQRNDDLHAIQRINAQLDAANRQLRATQVVRETTDALTQRHETLSDELDRALQTNQLTLHYQPLVDIASRRVVGLEALLRWHHPTLGAVSPGEFIPVAEASGQIVPIGEFALRSVCEQVTRWQEQSVPVVPVAVNLSAVQLERQDMWKVVRRILRDTGLPPHLLALELTESAIMKNAQDHVTVLQRLRDDGVHVQIDDFGTGYSSLSYLKHLPADTLKIDRSFISQLETSPTDEAIVGAILAMTRSLGLRAVAEGVETPAQLEVLGRHGCQVAQGFYFCRPIPADQCRELLLDLRERSSFTDTLRLRLSLHAGDSPRLTVMRGKANQQ